MDLLDLWRPARRLTWRKLGVLVRNLPPESALKTELRNQTPDSEAGESAKAADPAEGRWSHHDMLIALLIDIQRQLLYVLVKVNGGKADQPEPLPRPGVRRKRQPLSMENAEFLYRWINGPDAGPSP